MSKTKVYVTLNKFDGENFLGQVLYDIIYVDYDTFANHMATLWSTYDQVAGQRVGLTDNKRGIYAPLNLC